MIRQALLAGALAAVVAVGGVGGVWLLRDEPEGIERTRLALMDDDRFVSGPKAGATLADVSTWLLEDGTSCARARGERDPRCGARLSAAAYAGVAAFVVAECTAPGVYRARTSLLSYVRRIEAFDSGTLGSIAPPSPPDVPTCEERRP